MAAHVIVRFKDTVGVPYEDGIWGRLHDAIGPKWDAIAYDFPHLQVRRVFDEHLPAPGQKGPPDEGEGERYFDIEVEDVDKARDLIRRLRAMDDVVAEAFLRRRVILARGGDPAPGTFADVPASQDYLLPAPKGIDAVAAWNLHQARGQGVTIADVERGWYLDHVDLPRNIPVISGHIDSNKDHGVAVMGILVALHSGREVKGGAPDARALAASYVYEHAENVAGAIDDARKKLQPGDILLLEVVMDYESEDGTLYLAEAPAETQPDVAKALRRCARDGIVVIEPVGNADANLNAIDFDSLPTGAIMVGASVFDGNKHRQESKAMPSNYGTRVDCFARGHDLHTLGEPNGYQVFSGTSGASAIIAAAAALLQSVARRRFAETGRAPAYLKPDEMRDLLRNKDTGTLTDENERDARPIGVMPSLGHVIEHFLGPAGPDGAGFRAKPAVKGTGRIKKNGKAKVSTPHVKVRKK